MVGLEHKLVLNIVSLELLYTLSTKHLLQNQTKQINALKILKVI